MTYLRRARMAWYYIVPIVGGVSLLRSLGIGIDDVIGFLGYLVPKLLSVNSVFFTLGAVLLYFVYVHFRHRYTPLTVIHSKIVLELNRPDGRRATLRRIQRIRANHDNVTGYFAEFTAFPSGQIPKSEIVCHIDHCPPAKQTIEFDGDEKAQNNWTVIHRFTEIPRKLYMLGLNTVTREDSIVYIDAFTRDKEDFQVTIPERYPHKTIEFCVYFHPRRIPDIRDCHAVRIRAVGIEDLDLQPVLQTPDGGRGIKLVVKGQPGDRYRISWQHSPPEAKDAPPAAN